jgi:hypothetical protein
MRRLMIFGLVMCWLPIAAVAQTFTAHMTGAAEVPDPGDADGSGVAVFTIVGTTINYTLIARDIGFPSNGAHIHEAPAGVPGGIVVGLSNNFVDGRVDASVQGVDQAIIDRIKANPAGFYVNVHNAEFPGGAIRGQLTQGCTTTDTTLCVDGNRFRVDVSSQVPDGRVFPGRSVKLTSDTGYFWFFNADNVELIVKVLNGCVFPDINAHLVFASGLTNVEVDMTIIDTQSGAIQRYQNAQETAFQPIQEAPFVCP